MNDRTQKLLLSALAVGITAAISRPLTHYLLDAPDKRGAKDDVKEAALQGVTRTGAILLASVLVRRLSARRRSRQGGRRSGRRR